LKESGVAYGNVKVASPPHSRLESEFEAELGGERNADGGARAEEIAESAGGNAELLVA